MASTYWEKKIKKKKLFQKKKEIFLVNFGDCSTGLRPWTDFIYVNAFWSCYVINRGEDVSAGNKNQGFTHVLESTFESMKGVAEYIAHPAHVDTQRCSCLMWRSTGDWLQTQYGSFWIGRVIEVILNPVTISELKCKTDSDEFIWIYEFFNGCCNCYSCWGKCLCLL